MRRVKLTKAEREEFRKAFQRAGYAGGKTTSDRDKKDPERLEKRREVAAEVGRKHNRKYLPCPKSQDKRKIHAWNKKTGTCWYCKQTRESVVLKT